MQKLNDPEFVIGIAAVVLAPIMITDGLVRKTKKAVVNKIDEARCELYNRKHFDKKHPHLARKKK